MKKIILLLLLSTAIFAENKPDFSVIDTDGKVHTAKSTNDKFLVINFWATWCPPCIKEMPEFVDFYEKYNDKVEILGFDYEDISIQKSQDFTDGFMINYPIISMQNNKDEFKKFKVQFLPTSFIYDKNGVLIKEHTGDLNAKQLQEIMGLK